MKITIKDIGSIKQAEFALGDLTIICGKNNTGKTYATYALYGFLNFWRHTFSIKTSNDEIVRLLNEGAVEINIQKYIKDAQNILDESCNTYTELLPQIFAAPEKNFYDSQFRINLDGSDIHPISAFERIMGAANTELFSIIKKENSDFVNISLLVSKEKIKIPKNVLIRIIGDALKQIIFGDLFPNPFIASAERTGAAIFRKELNFARNRIVEEMGAMTKPLDTFEIISKVHSDYALPVRKNVDFTRQLEELSKNESFIAKNHPQILENFADIIGGDYVVNRNDELHYVPKGKKIKLTMDQSSSAVRSLLDIGFYLRHVAAKGDILIIDEPELNLHPENQRRVARLFSRIINLGIKVFLTTHSDYIIKELNTLIMFNQKLPRLRDMAIREGYLEDEFLNYQKVKVYIAEEALIKTDESTRKVRCQTLTIADVDEEMGIEVRSFDETIDEMNRIQEEIIWGE